MAIKIGCDPEFAVVDQHNRRVVFEWHDTSSYGIIKSDHGGAVGEFNPTPDEHPSVVVRNLKHLIIKTAEHYPSHRIVSGGGNQSTVRSVDSRKSWSLQCRFTYHRSLHG